MSFFSDLIIFQKLCLLCLYVHSVFNTTPVQMHSSFRVIKKIYTSIKFNFQKSPLIFLFAVFIYIKSNIILVNSCSWNVDVYSSPSKISSPNLCHTFFFLYTFFFISSRRLLIASGAKSPVNTNGKKKLNKKNKKNIFSPAAYNARN